MSAVAEAIPTQAKPRQIMLPPNRRELFLHKNNRHAVTVEEGVTIEDVLTPAFFGNVARLMQMYDEIVVRTDDTSFWAELLVLEAGPTWVRTKLLRLEKLSQDAQTPIDDRMNPYEVVFKGPVRKWAMLRKADQVIIHEGISTRVEAESYMRDYVRKTT